MQCGVHLPLMDFGGNEYDGATLRAYARLASELGFATLAANDHMVFSVPWLDGPTALASVIEASEPMTLATTVALPVVRGPVGFAKQAAALDRLSGGRMRVAVGPGSSERDYEVVGVDFGERWPRFDEVIGVLRALWDPNAEPFVGAYYSTEGIDLEPPPEQAGGPPIWVGSWGSAAGLRRVARLADGWLASAYNITPTEFADAWTALRSMLTEDGRDAATFPNALATMWFHLTDDPTEAESVFRERIVPTVHRPEDVLRERLPVGPADAFAEKLVAFRDAGVQEVLVWPVTDELRQLERFRAEVWPQVVTGDAGSPLDPRFGVDPR
jgi:alkanesulfonate monooxygenase SsuD/methylene tetrahydromethanopterin reductase-like flavin-dependent oxidoreductase (luciferase family)